MTEVKERPIIFSVSMVRAILAGRKTQTRRICRVQPVPIPTGFDLTSTLTAGCPYGKPGDRLWVRESFWERPYRSPKMMRDGADTWPPIILGADDSDSDSLREQGWIHRPAIYLPFYASTRTLEIIGVRVERLQDISDADACAEGFNHYGETMGPRWEFADLWNTINAKRGYSWESNPWVWVIEFRNISGVGLHASQQARAGDAATLRSPRS